MPPIIEEPVILESPKPQEMSNQRKIKNHDDEDDDEDLGTYYLYIVQMER